MTRTVAGVRVSLYDPPAIANCELWLPAERLTVGTIATFPDFSGRGRDFAQSSGGLQPSATLTGSPDGRPVLSLNGSTYMSRAAAIVGANAFTYFGVHKLTANGTIATLLHVGVGDGWLVGTNSTKRGMRGISKAACDDGYATDQWEVWVMSLAADGSGTVSWQVNGVDQGALVGGIPNAPSAASWVGGYQGSSFPATGLVGCIGLYSRILTSPERAMLGQRLASARGLATKQVVWMGNSNVVGTGVSDPTTQAPPAVLASLLGSAWRTVNRGTAGQTTAQEISVALVTVDPVLSAFRPKNIAVLTEVRNDIVTSGLSAAAAHANVATWCADRRAAGWQVVVTDCLPSASLSNVTRAAVNALILANWSTYADAHVPFSAAISADGANLDTNYYAVDGIHLNATGSALAAANVQTAVQTL